MTPIELDDSFIWHDDDGLEPEKIVLSPEAAKERLEKEYNLLVHGTPLPGSQIKFNRKTGTAFRPKEHKQRVFSVSETAREQLDPPFPIFGPHIPLAYSVQFVFPWRKLDFRTGKRAGELKENAPKYMLARKDLDNLLKPLNDGLQGILFHDDSQIVLYQNISKVFGHTPCTRIKCHALNGPQD